MQKKQIETLLYSAVGVLAMFLIVIAVNLIFGVAKKRIDLTHEKLYTLSDGTKAILKKIDTPVEIRFYFTQGEKEVPPQLKAYAQHIDDLLEVLVCPQCRQKVELTADGRALTCDHCRLRYRIDDDIPVMLVEEAEKY